MTNSNSKNGAPTSSATMDQAGISSLLATANFAPLKTIFDILGKDSHLHLVGGTVRDSLLGHPLKDYDLALRYPPEHSLTLLEEAGLKVVPTGIEHGTLLVVIDGNHFELTTFRQPGPRIGAKYSESIQEDLKGRDFTINAMAFSLEGSVLIDPHGGEEDLKKGLLRAVGDPSERFLEDPLRIMRMIRFGAAAGREVEAATLSAAKALSHLLNQVSIERIRVELEAILMSQYPRQAFLLMHQIGAMSIVLPELLPGVGFEQNEYHTHDVFEHTLMVLERAPEDLTVRLAALLHDTGKPYTLSIDDRGRRHFYEHEAKSREISRSVLERLKFSNEVQRNVELLVSLHMRPLTCGAPGVRRLIRDLGELLDSWLNLKRADATPVMDPKEFEAQYQHFRNLLDEEEERRKIPAYGKLAIDGHDLIQLGLKPSPEMGRILKELEELVLEDPSLNNREHLLHVAAEAIKKAKIAENC